MLCNGKLDMNGKEFGRESYLRCVVPSCLLKREVGISFHRFPKKDKDPYRWRKWVKALNIKHHPTASSRVCSRHFDTLDFFPIKSSDQTKFILKGSAIPKNVDLKKRNRENRARKREETRKNQTVTQKDDAGTIDDLELTNPDPVVSFHDAAIQVNTLEIDQLLEQKKRKVFVIRSTEQLISWTGLCSFELLDTLVKALQIVPETKLFSRWDVSLKNLILLVFIKLKTNMSFRCIASLFDVMPRTASNYFHKSVPIIADMLRVAVPWFSKTIIQDDLPYHFSKYGKVRAVLDCTEIPIQRASCLHCRILTYSHYKGRETAKYLVSVTPGGCFSYISPGFVGKASDKHIFNACGMVHLFDENDAVMVDKGFSISKELAEHNLEIVRPPMLFDSQLSQTEATTNVAIAGARVHVERGIQRLKNFRILTDKLDLSILYILDDVMIILAGVTNLSAPILADNRFSSSK